MIEIEIGSAQDLQIIQFNQKAHTTEHTVESTLVREVEINVTIVEMEVTRVKISFSIQVLNTVICQKKSRKHFLKTKVSRKMTV